MTRAIFEDMVAGHTAAAIRSMYELDAKLFRIHMLEVARYVRGLRAGRT